MDCIPSDTFEDCTRLVNALIPEGVKHIDTDAFTGCSSIEEVELPSTLIEVNDRAFDDCFNLKIVKAYTATNFQNNAFSECNEISIERYTK